MKIQPYQYFIHLIGWCFLYILPYLFSFNGVPNVFTLFSQKGDYLHLVSFLLLVAFSYTNHWLFVPKFYFKKKYLYYFVVLCICFWIVINVPIYILPDDFSRPMSHHSGDEPKPLLFGRNYNVLLFIFCVFGSLLIYNRKQLYEIEKEKLNAELAFLRAQINPHFLFNTLNSIYSLALAKDDKTPDAVIQLSELLRYIIRDVKNEMVSLEREISYISNYVSLQKSRLRNTVKVDYEVTGDFTGKEIAPLILVTFIENAFKHGVNPDKYSEVQINISMEDNVLHLYVFNTKVGSIGSEEGIGLRNTITRLDLLYPLKWNLKTDDNKETYSIKLAIALQ